MFLVILALLLATLNQLLMKLNINVNEMQLISAKEI